MLKKNDYELSTFYTNFVVNKDFYRQKTTRPPRRKPTIIIITIIILLYFIIISRKKIINHYYYYYSFYFYILFFLFFILWIIHFLFFFLIISLMMWDVIDVYHSSALLRKPGRWAETTERFAFIRRRLGQGKEIVSILISCRRRMICQRLQVRWGVHQHKQTALQRPEARSI